MAYRLPLLHWDPADWVGAPGVDCGHPECAFWAARDRWNDENPATEWPSIVAAGPDVPFGPGAGHWVLGHG